MVALSLKERIAELTAIRDQGGTGSDRVRLMKSIILAGNSRTAIIERKNGSLANW